MRDTVDLVADKVWTAQELERMTPAERHALFKASLTKDLDQVPEQFLERVRNGLEERIAGEEAQQQ